ncbi:hypothetical protein DY000_02046635 [Brassica cretica]|uniref:Uncharacterized protein n=1 Tax=Brassica cretica TaxID=69181 RepID=A0ABQ7F9B3_BRACR|nr:hypothetical protein DY000_02046635 [Brassica cretica]
MIMMMRMRYAGEGTVPLLICSLYNLVPCVLFQPKGKVDDRGLRTGAILKAISSVKVLRMDSAAPPDSPVSPTRDKGDKEVGDEGSVVGNIRIQAKGAENDQSKVENTDVVIADEVLEDVETAKDVVRAEEVGAQTEDERVDTGEKEVVETN